METELDLEIALSNYVRFMELNEYSHQQVNRRSFTLQRFVETYEYLSDDNLKNFIKDNNFMRAESYCLLKMDILCFLRYLEKEKLISERLFEGLEMEL